MQQGVLIRALGTLVTAAVGAGIALGGAALSGGLGAATTIERVTQVPALTASATAAPHGVLSVQQIYRLDAPGVVQITRVPSPANAPAQLGSGFVIDKAGHIVTSNAVLHGAQAVKVSFSGNEQLDATIVGEDPSTDVALLQVSAHSRSLTPLLLGDSDAVQVGDAVVAIGNTRSFARTATVGIVSAVERGVDAPNGAPAAAHSIQTDAPIGLGNSGGPL